MSSDGKIYIVITDKRPEGEGGSVIQSQSSSVQQEKNEYALIDHWAKGKLINEVKSLSRSAVMYSLNNIGNFTGNYIMQTQVNNTISNLSSLANIGVSAIAGAKMFGIPGAIIAGSLAIINSNVSSALHIHSLRVENRKINYEIEQLRDRAGLNTTLDGSRGTEN